MTKRLKAIVMVKAEILFDNTDRDVDPVEVWESLRDLGGAAYSSGGYSVDLRSDKVTIKQVKAAMALAIKESK